MYTHVCACVTYALIYVCVFRVCMHVCMCVYACIMCRWAGRCMRVYVCLISQSLLSLACIECCDILFPSGSNFLAQTLYSAAGMYRQLVLSGCLC